MSTIEKNEEIQAFQQQSTGLVEQANKIAIVTDSDLEFASEFVNRVVKRYTPIEKELDTQCEMNHKAWKNSTEFRKKVLAPYKEAESIVKKKVSDHMQEKERIRRELQAKADAEAREADRKEKERLARLAEKQMDAGKMDKAEETLDRIDTVYHAPAPVQETVKSVKTEAGGLTGIKDINVEVVDLFKLLAAVLNRQLPPGCVSVNLSIIKRTMKDYGITPQAAAEMGVKITESFSVRRI